LRRHTISTHCGSPIGVGPRAVTESPADHQSVNTSEFWQTGARSAHRQATTRLRVATRGRVPPANSAPKSVITSDDTARQLSNQPEEAAADQEGIRMDEANWRHTEDQSARPAERGLAISGAPHRVQSVIDGARTSFAHTVPPGFSSTPALPAMETYVNSPAQSLKAPARAPEETTIIAPL